MHIYKILFSHLASRLLEKRSAPIHNRVPRFTPTTSYSTRVLSLPAPYLIQGSHRMHRNPPGVANHSLSHAFITAFHSLLSCMNILLCSTDIYSFFTLSIHLVLDLPLNLMPPFPFSFIINIMEKTLQKIYLHLDSNIYNK